MKYLIKEIESTFIRTLKKTETVVSSEELTALSAMLNGYGEYITELELESLSNKLKGNFEILGYLSKQMVMLTSQEVEIYIISNEAMEAFSSLAYYYQKNDKNFEKHSSPIAK